MKLPLVALLPLLLAITSCSNQPKQPPVFSESFITNISEDGIRLFTYQARLSRAESSGRHNKANRNRQQTANNPQGRGGKGQGPGRQGQANVATLRQKMRENADKLVVEQLEKHLQATNFCDNDYLILEKTVEFGQGLIRGECR